MLEHKGYYAEVTVDLEYGILFGRSVGMKDGFTFQAKSVDDVVPAFHEAVEDYLEFCATDGVEPAKPFSGKIALRVPPEIHRAATSAAKEQGQSLNAWLTSLIAKSINEPEEPQSHLSAKWNPGSVYFITTGQPECGYVALGTPPEAAGSPGAGRHETGVVTRGVLFQPAPLPIDPAGLSAV